jgi:tetratricopeptide (TPR) repeat protein
VAGDTRLESVETCGFPAALFEGLEQRLEPLAADARKWADGKPLAKLKLVAALLGISLDELRQRDLQRQRKLRAIAGLAIAAVLALLVMTLVAQVSSRHERELAEQMATFIVDLGEKLQSETDLETLASISAEASKHFRDLDPDKLTAETGKRVALTLRQVGRISQLQGKPTDALQAFVQSRDVLSGLSTNNPESAELLYELGNAEFYIGNFHLEQGDYTRARQACQKYHEIAGRLLALDPDNPEWMMERSYSHNNLAAVQLQSGLGVDEPTLAHLQEAIVLIENVMQKAPDKSIYASHYATTLAWAADAQYQACNLDNAIALRQKASHLAATLAQLFPGDNDLKRRYAYAISGVSVLQTNTGQTELAGQNLRLVIAMLEQLSAADPSNILYIQQIAYRQFRLARLMAATGNVSEAGALMSELAPKIGLDSGIAAQNDETRPVAIDFHLAYARVKYQQGDKSEANRQLENAMKLLLDDPAHSAPVRSEREQLEELRFLWWEINGEADLARIPRPAESRPAAEGTLRSCEDALIAAKESVIAGEPDKALPAISYLQERGYAEPLFMQFCTKYGLCAGTPVSPKPEY